MGLWTQRVEPDEIDENVAGTAHLLQAEVLDKVANLCITVVGDRGVLRAHQVSRHAAGLAG
jgi:hypothetical protein